MATETSLEQRTGTLYKGVTFEPKAFYYGNDKKLLTYDASLERLQRAGFSRHARPQEVFGLLIANLENKLTPQQKSVADDMLNSYGEWLSAAVERSSDTLTAYTDPEGLVWDGSAYVKQNFKFESKREFSVAGIPSQQWVDLNKFGNDLVEFLYTRKFEQLPQAMREGGRRAQLYLPPDGQIRPAGRGNFNDRFNVGSGSYDSGASRGVVPSARKKSRLSRTPAMTPEQLLEEKLTKILLPFDQFISPASAEKYDIVKPRVLQQLEDLYHGK